MGVRPNLDWADLKIGDVVSFETRFMTPEQVGRAMGIDELDRWFAEHFPAHRVTEQERHDYIYNNKPITRQYVATEDCRIDILTGTATIPIKPTP